MVDDALERALMALLLAWHPGQLSIGELARELGPHAADAARELEAAGLAHRHGEFVFATRAAVRAAELAG